MTPPEVEKALRTSFVRLKEKFGGVILGMGAIDLLRGHILDLSFGLPPYFIRQHGRIINLIRRNADVLPTGFGSYYMLETEDRGMVVVFNVANRFALIVFVKLDTVQMGTVILVLINELRDLLSVMYDPVLLERIERIRSLKT